MAIDWKKSFYKLAEAFEGARLCERSEYSTGETYDKLFDSDTNRTIKACKVQGKKER